MDPFVGEIRLFAGNFAPRGWAMCSGQVLPLAQNTALFSLLGTTYGGNGTSTFALPNLNGSVPVGAGAAPGRTALDPGMTGGDADTVPGAAGASGSGTLALNFIIALQGIYPPRG